jgi:succinate-semialdehyde dehydrogenase / glutarate-semialdehyde dehydrogenase
MAKLFSTNPANNEVLGEVEYSSEDEVIEKVKKANDAKKAWKDLGVENRVKLLREVVKKFIEKKEEFAQLMTKEMGMPIAQSRYDTGEAIKYFTWYLDNAPLYLAPEVVHEDDSSAHTVFHEPFGVAAVIAPWNFPLSVSFVWDVALNLIAGNTVVYKTSEECPLFGKMIEEVIIECNLPEGVFSEIYGDGKTGDFLVHQDVNIIIFTGSTKVGKYLYNVAAEKFIKTVLELGGSAPGIVFEDAHLDEAIELIYLNRYTNCGQMCDALKRLIVHESIFDATVGRLKKHLESVKVGDPSDETTDIGPLVAERQLVLLEEQVKDAVDKGAKVVVGGKRIRSLGGAFFEPTILINVTRDMRIWQEEVFGPVLPIVSFDTDDQAVHMANDTKYGLGAYVYTINKKRAIKTAIDIDTGMVSVNTASYLQPASPFGGYKDSGIGREHGKYGFRELTQLKVVAAEK